MTDKVSIQDITAGHRPIKDGREFNHYFPKAEEEDRIIIDDAEVEDTVELMKKVVWKYIDDTKLIAQKLKSNSLENTCNNVWNFLYHHIQYHLDKKGLEQLRRPARSWQERVHGIDCDCFSIFVSSILTNLHIPHTFRITMYGLSESYQHVYVIVPHGNSYITIDCVLNQFNYEKPYSHKKDFTMNLQGINVAVLSGTEEDVFDLISGVEGLGEINGSENEQAIFEHLVKTRNMIQQNPELISTVEYTPGFLEMLNYAIDNWNSPNRQIALDYLEKNEQEINRLHGFEDSEDLDGFEDDIDDQFGKIITKKSKSGKTKKVRKPQKKQFFKKVGEAVKKGGKAFVRFNPVTVSARGGFLLALKMNLKKMASKLQWAYKTKEEAKKNGVSEGEWNKAREGLKKVEKLFVNKLQGKKAALKKAILNHKRKGMHGFEDELLGLGVAPAAALAAAIPVITQAIKSLVDSGVMKKEDAANIEAEINSKVSNVTDADIQEAESSGGSSDDKGIMAFVKKQPLVAVGGAALGIWGLAKLFGGNKKKDASLGKVKVQKKKAGPKSVGRPRKTKARTFQLK